ncbi:MAG: ABC transporter ATP-binding protein [Deltaproteobacteria bacterium]|nr:ABC transporter ATP-binding protein [Deltaproteobacteria bacterium]
MTSVLRLRDVCFAYGSREVLSGVSLSIGAGTFVALLGPNGAGKSTLLRMLAGLAVPTSGEVSLGEASLAGVARGERARRIAWLSQSDHVVEGLTVRAYVGLGRAPYTAWHGALSRDDLQEIERAIAWARLDTLAERPVSGLSGGELRRAALARVVAQGAEVLLCDEPTAFLDPRQQWQVCESLAELVRTQGKTVVMVVHDPAMALRYCSHAALVCEGRLLASGEVAQVLDGPTLSRAFEVQVRVGRDEETALPYVLTVGDGAV